MRRLRFSGSGAPACGETPWRGPFAPRWILATAAIAGIAAVVLMLSRGTPRVNVPDESTVSLSTWRAPTDFLLQTPGRDLLATVPRLGMQTAPRAFLTTA